LRLSAAPVGCQCSGCSLVCSTFLISVNFLGLTRLLKTFHCGLRQLAWKAKTNGQNTQEQRLKHWV
jgi:hypothetical protein